MRAAREPSPWGPLRRHPWVLGVAVLLAVAAVVVGALGGFARTTPEGLRAVDPGERVEVTPFEIRLDRASADYEVAGDLADEGRAFVVVEGTLALTAPESVERTVLGEAFAADLRSTYTFFDGPEEEGAPTTVHVAEDGSELLGIGPGLTYDVLLVWEIDEPAVPTTMTVALREHTWRPSFLDGIPGWFAPEPVARVTLDIAPLPDERPVEEDLL